MKKLTTIFYAVSIILIVGFLYSCGKEGPIGPAGPAGKDGVAGKDGKDGVNGKDGVAGKDGVNGTNGKDGVNGTNGKDGADGKDANETCILCHSPAMVDRVSTEFQLSKHLTGAAAYEEAGNTGCTPCHAQEAFKYVIESKIPATFTKNSTTGKFANDYATVPSLAFGEIGCFTCHSKLHTTYGVEDLALTTTDPVPMTMWKGNKTINLEADGGTSNLCVRCHQPRPLTTSSTLSDGDVIDYASLIASPTAVYHDSAVGNKAPNKIAPSYRTHIHYGAVGAIYAGVGGVEFQGSMAYGNSAHTKAASCSDCHQAKIQGRAGGHTFKMRATEGALGSSTAWNFNGCNVSGCHESAPLDANAAKFKNTRSEVKKLLETLAGKIKTSGFEIMHRNAIAEPNEGANLWAGVTSNNYDGYLDVYDPTLNPTGALRNATNTSAENLKKPKVHLLNVQVGAMINFQLCLREYSLGIHNAPYSKALLTNTIEALTAAGF